MKINNQITLVTVVALSAIASSVMPASAIPYNNNSVYKAIDGNAQVVVFSGTAGSKISVNLGNSEKSTAKLVGACGEIRISPPASGDFAGLKVDGNAINAASLPTQTLPSCVNGSFSEMRNTNFKTANNQVVIVGKTPGASVSISIPSVTTKSITINGCGFGVLKPNSNQSLPASFSVNSNNYTLSSLPNAGNPPICRTVNGTPYGYVPASW
ncbi:MAG: hypothetical protein ACIWVG_24270 [Gloeotrichia echinulata HAB0833]